LLQLRTDISTSLSQVLQQRDFVFLTSHGWEVNKDLEGAATLSDVLTCNGVVKIRLRYDRPRLGIVVEGTPDVPVGFVFCGLWQSITDLSNEIASQLPTLYSSLLSKKLCFLDRNSWPVSKDQESSLSVLDIATSSCVRIRCTSKGNYSRKTSMIEGRQEDSDQQLSIAASLPLDILAAPDTVSRERMSPIPEWNEGLTEATWKSADYTDTKIEMSDTESFEILLSYVHTEASRYALLLKAALEEQGYSVFLDIHCIEGGKDWQDVLNSAITNCKLFVPLITMQYGKTLWTNREIKLADVLQKVILPVNFNENWPPKCLAIQFATTQYIPSNLSSATGATVTLETFQQEDASTIAVKISEQFKKEQASLTASRSESDSAEMDVGIPTLVSRQSTEIYSTSAVKSPPSAGLAAPFSYSHARRRRSALKSYASNLPDSIPEQYRVSVSESRQGKPLIVISCAPKQREFADGLALRLQSEKYEVWCSLDVHESTDEEKSEVFQLRVDEAGAVVFILSKDFAEDTFCEQQVYYCEQRKRIIPVLYEPHEMPIWMSTLIGTSTFIDCKSQSYLTALLARVSTVLNPKKAEDELKQVLKQKAEVAILCSQLEKKIPKGDHVYISGGTKFFSKNGEAISKEIGRQLANEDDIILVTGGFYGVGETVGKSFFDERERLNRPPGVCHVVAEYDEQDKSSQTRQNPDHTFQPVPYGETLFFGSSVRQREMLTPRVVKVCILIEGGPGAAFEAQQFVWNGHNVIPIRITGGAAGGAFNVPSVILIRPPNVAESDWSVLGDENSSPSDIASAIVRIVRCIISQDVLLPIIRSRSSTEKGVALLAKLKNDRDKVKRADSDLAKRSDATMETLKGVRRAFSEI
jgi:predicted Rossmann-fold nucleotide-binding protein